VAGNNQETIRSGSCSGAANWKLKLSPENGGTMEVDYEIDVNRAGQRWRVTLFHQGRRIHRTVHVTRGRSGSFTAKELQSHRRGVVRAKAVRLGDGQRCGGVARF
jgi:hypothetical protein